uniref:Protein phosphatase 2C n=1 Tax=Marseillevirus LCMAC101 TaxID=2506602 RepID=A0A481YSN7_9VIRU|nr:MAG: hypothetical protein LCMAC101_05950 [Marseillevirus LCMAC101]
MSPDQYEKNGIPHIKSFASTRNVRRTMEDEAFVSILSPGVCFCAVLDGHGGMNAVKHFVKAIPRELGNALGKLSDLTGNLVEETIKKVFLDEDEKWYESCGDTSGTTFTGVLVLSEKNPSI